MADLIPNSNALDVSVSELSSKLKRTVEDTFGNVRVRGEISGYRGPHSSGHSYFSLKDDRARLEAVIWRGQAAKLKHLPEEGLEVIASGKLTTYPGSSKYQIVIDNIEPAGAGALMALLEERRKKLTAEGLFDEGRKQLLPFMPKVIGVVTSPTGAVIRDILHRLNDRFPVHVIVWPVRVQGETSGREVANGVYRLNQFEEDGPLPRPDIIIVARGGGSLEDLWGFNDEVLVRAVADSFVPVISAVGHETDWTLVDHAADWRAPTPTAAAERAVPVKAELEATLADLGARLRGAVSRLGERRRNDVRAAARGLKTPDMLLALPRRAFDDAAGRLGTSLQLRVQKAQNKQSQVGSRLSINALQRRVNESRIRFSAVEKAHQRSLLDIVSRRKERFSNLSQRVRPAPLLNRLQQHQSLFDRMSEQLIVSLDNRMQRSGERLSRNERLLKTLSYQGVLDRGFAVIRDSKNRPLTGISKVKPGAEVIVEMGDGTMNAVASGLARKDTAPKAKSTPSPSPKEGQGDLF